MIYVSASNDLTESANAWRVVKLVAQAKANSNSECPVSTDARIQPGSTEAYAESMSKFVK